MKKGILTEINRMREIIGLAHIVEQESQSSWKTHSSSFESKMGKKAQKYKGKYPFYNDTNNHMQQFITTHKNDLWKILQTYDPPFESENMIHSLIYAINNNSKLSELFLYAQNNPKYLATIIAGDYFEAASDGKVPVRLMETAGGQILISYRDSKGDLHEAVTPEEMCRTLNTLNQRYLGKSQIIDIIAPDDGNINKVVRSADDPNYLYLYSAKAINRQYNQEEIITKKGTEGSGAVAASEGEKIKGGDAFEVYEGNPQTQLK